VGRAAGEDLLDLLEVLTELHRAFKKMSKGIVVHIITVAKGNPVATSAQQ
jgi:hypothetical protein